MSNQKLYVIEGQTMIKLKRTNYYIPNTTQKNKDCNNMINILNTLKLIRSTVLKEIS